MSKFAFVESEYRRAQTVSGQNMLNNNKGQSFANDQAIMKDPEPSIDLPDNHGIQHVPDDQVEENPNRGMDQFDQSKFDSVRHHWDHIGSTKYMSTSPLPFALTFHDDRTRKRSDSIHAWVVLETLTFPASPQLSIRLAVLTVSPADVVLEFFTPTIPATTGRYARRCALRNTDGRRTVSLIYPLR